MSVSPQVQFPVLALDYGTKRVGVALAETLLAEPLVVLENDETLLPRLETLIREHDVKQIVVGISEGPMAERSHQFAMELQVEHAIPVIEWDETLTTKTAEKHLASRKKSSPHRELVDHLAAAEILQDYLDVNGVLY